MGLRKPSEPEPTTLSLVRDLRVWGGEISVPEADLQLLGQGWSS